MQRNRLKLSLKTLILTLFFTSQLSWSATVLLYHHISTTTPRATSTSPEEFRQHLQMIEDEGFEVWPLSKITRYLATNQPLPSRVTAISFDDAFSSILTEAAPLLEQRHWPYTIFVNSKAVDERHSHMLNWQQLNSLQSRGAELANHSHSHSHLVKRLNGETEEQWTQRMRTEITTTSKKLKQHTGSESTLFAYPYGEYDYPLQAIVRELGFTAFGQQSGALSAALDNTALPRFPAAGAYANPKTLRTKLLSQAMPLAKVDIISGDEINGLTPYKVDIPKLKLQFNDGNWRLGQLSCFASGQGRIKTHREGNSVTVEANQAISIGRSRYNCTMPSNEAGRYYWFSQPWIRFSKDQQLPND